MLHTLTDQIHFHRRKTKASVQDGIEHHGQVFVVFYRASRVIAPFTTKAKAALSGGSATFDRVGRTDTPRIFRHP
ncbi:hypothetical protein ELX64_27270 (plasmid) [Escherichia coli]|nr:hypothetical protein ELX64_27270 [Escherichia coli]